jgi:hypothetical protein
LLKFGLLNPQNAKKDAIQARNMMSAYTIIMQRKKI